MRRQTIRLTAETFGRAVLPIGRVNENNAVRVEIDLSAIVADAPSATASLTLEAPNGTVYSATVTMTGGVLRWDVAAADVTVSGTGKAQLTVYGPAGEVLKSAVAATRIGHSIRGEGPAPDPVQNWVDDAANKLNSVAQAGEEATKAASSANAAAEAANTAAKNAQTVADTVQEKLDNGEFVGPAGKPGSDASVTAENIQAALGYTPVKDVRIVDESLVADGVAKVPNIFEITDDFEIYARKKPEKTMWDGIVGIDKNGKFILANVDESLIDNRRKSNIQYISLGRLDYAVKAAMCDGKGAAWTDAEQQAARERMGIDKPYEVIEEITLAEESSVVRTIELNGTPYNFAVIMLRAEFPAIEKTGNIYISYKIGNINRQISSYFLSPYKADAVKYGYSKVWVENSRYRSGGWSCVENDGQFAQYYENPVLQDKYSVADGNIIGFTTSVIAAGTKITVYGVRA